VTSDLRRVALIAVPVAAAVVAGVGAARAAGWITAVDGAGTVGVAVGIGLAGLVVGFALGLAVPPGADQPTRVRARRAAACEASRATARR
jgi:hypothetical protein